MADSTILNSVFAASMEGQTNDKLGPYPEKLDVRAMPERRYLWTSRSLGLVSILSMCFNLVLTSIIMMLSPQLRSIPKLYGYDIHFPKIIEIEPMHVHKTAVDIIMEDLVEDYLKLRMEVLPDIDVMESRWAEGNTFAWQTINMNQFLNTKEIMLARLRDEGFTRDVEVLTKFYVGRNIWSVTFDTTDRLPDVERPIYKRWRATIETSPRGMPRDPDIRRKNPFQFGISFFSLGSLPHPLEDQNPKGVGFEGSAGYGEAVIKETFFIPI